MTFRDIYVLKPTPFGRAFVHDYLNSSRSIFLCGSTTVKLQWIDLNRTRTVLTRTQPHSRLFLSTFGVPLLPQYAMDFLFYAGGYEVSKEAPSRPIREQMLQVSAYEVVESTSSIVDTMQLITTTRIAQFALVMITLHFEHEGKITPAELIQVVRSTTYFLESVRPLVRKTDAVFLLDHTFYFLLLGANEAGGNIVQTRLWDALLWRIHNIHDCEILRPRFLTIGHSAYPLPYNEFDECIGAARAVLQSFGTHPQKTIRKATYRQTKLAQSQSNEEELPELARKLGIPYLMLLPRRPPEQVQQLVDPKLAQELHCYPLGRERGTLTVAIANPQDRTALDRLRQQTGLHIFPVLAHPHELQSALEQLV